MEEEKKGFFAKLFGKFGKKDDEKAMGKKVCDPKDKSCQKKV